MKAKNGITPVPSSRVVYFLKIRRTLSPFPTRTTPTTLPPPKWSTSIASFTTLRESTRAPEDAQPRACDNNNEFFIFFPLSWDISVNPVHEKIARISRRRHRIKCSRFSFFDRIQYNMYTLHTHLMSWSA